MPRRSLSLVAERPVVAMCVGKDCRKRGEYAKLHDALDAACDLVDMACVGLCNGPVVALDPRGSQPEVYSKLRSKRHRTLVIAAASGDDLARRNLSGRRVVKKKVVNKVVSRVSRPAQRRRTAKNRAA